MDRIIVNILLDKYERSSHVSGSKSNRRIMIKPEDIIGYSKTEYEAVRLLEDSLQRLGGIVDFEMSKKQRNLVSKIILPLKNVSAAYEYANRVDIKNNSGQILSMLKETLCNVHAEWIIDFLNDEIGNLERKFKTSSILKDNVELTNNICKVLRYVDRDAFLMRTLSVNCFNDSKYIEKELKRKLISIAKRYEPDIKEALQDMDNKPTDSEILTQIGIITSPEIYEFCGKCGFMLNQAKVDISGFINGYCINSEMVGLIDCFCMGNVKRVLFVENRTNYRQLILNGVEDDMLLIFHGGFYSPTHGELFEKIYLSANKYATFLFWGDIDLGGFKMFSRLKRNIIPTLVPFKMDVETFMKTKEKGIRTHTPDYFDRLENYICEKEFEEVKTLILKHTVTVEQESLI